MKKQILILATLILAGCSFPAFAMRRSNSNINSFFNEATPILEKEEKTFFNDPTPILEKEEKVFLKNEIELFDFNKTKTNNNYQKEHSNLNKIEEKDIDFLDYNGVFTWF